MFSSASLFELTGIIFLILVNLLLRYRRKYYQYDLTSTILILASIWAFHVITIEGTPIFYMIGRSFSTDNYFYDESVAIALIIGTGFECVLILMIRSHILRTSVTSFLDIERLSRQLAIGLAISIITFGFLSLISLVSTGHEHKFGGLDPTKTGYFSISIIITVVVIIAPVVEEIIFRGFLLLSVERSIGKMFALIISSLAWALFHPDNFVGHLVSGMILALLFLRTRSLIPPMMLHGARNLFYMLSSLAIF